jgi:HlyD family secretion protein
VKRNWLKQRPEAMGVLAAAVLAAGLLLEGCSKSGGKDPDEEAADQKAAASPVPVQVATAAARDLQPVVHFVGRVTLDPASVATICAPADCVVESLVAAEGQHVAKGAPLVEMDRRPAECETAKAAAALARSQAALSLLKAGPRPEDVEVAQQDVRSRQLDLESAQVQLKAKEQLQEKDMVSAVDLQETRRKMAAAESALRAAQAKLDLLEKGPRPQEITQAEADQQAAAADEALARVRLERCTVRAPIEGELVKISVHPGMGLTVGAPVAEIVDLRHVLVEGVIPLSQVAQVQAGTTGRITTAAYPDHPFEGRVIRISHQAEADTGELPVWLSVDNPEKLLRRDMVVRVTLDTDPVKARVVVPQSAVIELDGQLIAMVVKDGKTHNCPIRLGRRVDDFVEVLEGLSPGDQVVTSGGYGLPEGYPVVVKEGAGATQAASRPGPQEVQ